MCIKNTVPALGFQSGGLALWFGEQLSWTLSIHPYLILIAIVTMMWFLIELTSNAASTHGINSLQSPACKSNVSCLNEKVH
jgi:hypothetical protein